jgi:hypothetical protein
LATRRVASRDSKDAGSDALDSLLEQRSAVIILIARRDSHRLLIGRG